MDTVAAPPPDNEGLWRTIFETGDPKLASIRAGNLRLPGAPRCRLCKAPFGGLGGFYLKLRGNARALRSPHYCNNCDKFIAAHPGGAEVTMSMIFADVRQSTTAAAKSTPTEFRARMEVFFRAARAAIVDSDGFVAEFRGDCAVGTFPPGFCGPDHARLAIACARRLLQNFATASRSAMPVGVGVHTGRVFVGTLGLTEPSAYPDVGILGQAANVCALLSQTAGAGEALITEAAASAAGQVFPNEAKRDVSPKGEEKPVAVFAMTVT